jgi:hypothetical protein
MRQVSWVTKTVRAPRKLRQLQQRLSSAESFLEMIARGGHVHRRHEPRERHTEVGVLLPYNGSSAYMVLKFSDDLLRLPLSRKRRYV